MRRTQRLALLAALLWIGAGPITTATAAASTAAEGDAAATKSTQAGVASTNGPAAGVAVTDGAADNVTPPVAPRRARSRGPLRRGWAGVTPGRAQVPQGSMLQYPLRYPMRPATSSNAGKLNLNTATLQQIQELPSVGAAWAPVILAGRPYQIIDDLARDGVPLSTIERIRDLVYFAP